MFGADVTLGDMMQIRKLVKSGHASLVVAVPKDWIKRNKLKAGDMLYIDDCGGTLSLTAEKHEERKEDKKAIINTDGMELRKIFYEITAAYLNNAQMIIIKGSNVMKHSKELKNYISNLVALELIDECSDKIVTKSFLNIPDSDPKVIIRRMDNIVRSMITDTRECIKNPDMADHIMHRDREVNRLNLLNYKLLKYAYNNRDVVKVWGMKEIDIMKYWEVNVALEKIGDRVKNIARVISRLTGTHKAKFLAILKNMEEQYKDAMKSFYQSSFKQASDTAASRHPIIDSVQKDLVNNDCVTCSKLAMNSFIMIANINNITRAVRYLD